MKNLLKLIVLIAFAINTTFTNATTVGIRVFPQDTIIGACLQNVFTVRVLSQYAWFKIHAQLNSNTNPSCNPPYPLKISIDTIIGNVSFVTGDTTDVKMYINDSDSITIQYHVFIDCALVPPINDNSVPVIALQQIFTDTTSGGVNYSVNGGSSSYFSQSIVMPIISDASIHYYTSGYLDTLKILNYYVNNGTGKAPIIFNFVPDSGNYCNKLKPLSLQYRKTGTLFQTYTAGVDSPIVLNKYDSLVFQRTVIDTTCLDSCSAGIAQFKWRCNNPKASNVFCTECRQVYNTSYEVHKALSYIKVERLQPSLSDAMWDTTCINGSQVHWVFRVTNPSNYDALDSVFIKIKQTNDYPEYLSLMPKNSLTIDSSKCIGCTISSNYSTRLNSLCSSIYSPNNLILEANIKAKTFLKTDTLIVSFNTFKCIQEVDSLLLNKRKFFTQWQFLTSAKNICNEPSAKIDITGLTGSAISSYGLNNTVADVEQNLFFIPTTSDLSVPPDSTFGDSATFNIELKGLMNQAYDYQLLGCKTQFTDSCTLQGYLRATVHCEDGLRMEFPASNARLKLADSTGNFVYHFPTFNNDNVIDTLCMAGDYFFYFDLSDSTMLQYLDSGFFEFTLQACCGNNLPKTPYEVKFHLLPFPSSSCDSVTFFNTAVCNGGTCSWLPLSSKGKEISVHCPGCVSPGMIVDAYDLHRLTYGLRDSDNDGKADVGLTQIQYQDSFFVAHQQDIKPQFSGFGQELEDVLTAHFQEGDASNNGYTYVQMDSLGAQVHWLQLSRKISAGLDTMQVTPEELTLYIDTPDNTATANCIDCNTFDVKSNNFRTQEVLHAVGNDVYLYLDTITNANHYLFSFSAFDTLGILSGNLFDDDSLTGSSYIFIDTIRPFTRFYEGQQYRFKVRYKTCGNFLSHPQAPWTFDDVVKESTIENKMWLTGKKQAYSAYDLNLTAPQYASSVYNAGWALDSSQIDSAHVLMNQQFADSFVLVCEVFGGIHYFVSQNAVNSSRFLPANGCNQYMYVISSVNIAQNVYNPFPFEYVPPALFPQSHSITIPPGFKITRARVQHNGQPVFLTTNWFTFSPPNNTGTFTLYDSLLPPKTCLVDTSIIFYPSDSAQYVPSLKVTRTIQFLLEPDSCFIGYYQPHSFNVISTFDKTDYPCLPPSACNITNPPVAPMKDTSFVLVNYPNLTIKHDSIVYATQHHFCFDYEFKNPVLNVTPTIYSTHATNVYIAVPDSATIPFLTNWCYTLNGTTTYAVGGIIAITDSLGRNDTIQGQLCADVITCVSGDSYFDVFTGWNCDSFPVAPFDTNSVCSFIKDNIHLISEPASAISDVKSHPANYLLCQPFSFWGNLKTTYTGGIYPFEVTLDTLPQGLNILSVVIQNCDDSTATDTLTQSGTLRWNITSANLIACGFPDSALFAPTNLNCIKVFVTAEPTCVFAGDSTLPSITTHSHKYCEFDSVLTTTSPFTGNISMNGTACSDCFTLSKTANTDTVAIGDTVTFTIQVCSHNAANDSLYLTELLPSSTVFTFISSTPTFPYTNNNFPPDTCINYTVKGKYKSAGSCPDALFQNKVTLTSGIATYTDSVCVNVVNPCTTTDSIFADSTFSTAWPDTLNNISIYVAGTFYVTDSLTLRGCTVYVNAGGQIIVTSTGNLIQNSTTIQSCDTMWRGVKVTRGKIALVNSSVIRDANNGIYAENGSSVTINSGSKIFDSVLGFFVPPLTSSLNNITVSIKDATFTMQSTSFKPDYIGQPTHGTRPRAGIEVYGMPSLTIGGGVSTLNTFSKMNNGIIAHNSVVTIKNSKFYDIAVDTIYTEPYHGATMVSVKDESFYSVTNPKLSVLPENGTFNTVDSSFRAIYTDGSVLSASFLNLLNVTQGIYGTKTPTQQVSMVSNCTITSTTTGIFWINNGSAKRMFATSNNITINGGIVNSATAKGWGRGAIFMAETNINKTVLYKADYNNITLNNAFYGIAQVLTNKGIIKSNIIKINPTYVNFNTSGVSLASTYRVNTSCNNIISFYPTTGITHQTSAIFASLTQRSYIGCNILDSTWQGIYFGGFNPVTRLKGNSFNTHLDGLYLNNVAVIDSQPHGGNHWYGPFTHDGALNTAPFNLVLQSPFLIDQNDFFADTSLVPSSVSPSGWFTFFPGNTFGCNTQINCPQLPPIEYTSDELAQLIANGYFQTEEYMDESKAIAEEYLYGELMEDSSIWINDSIYAAFISANEDSAIGELYRVDYNFELAIASDSFFLPLIASVDSQSIALLDSLNYIDSLAEASNPIPDYDLIRQQLIDALSFLAQTNHNLHAQLNSMRDDFLENADLQNELVVPEELPQDNAKIINDIEIEYLESSEDINILRNYYETYLAIAHQCPYAGGEAVNKARIFVAQINPDEVYSDVDVCLQNGIYRQAPPDSLNHNSQISEVKLIPNPANNKISVLITGTHKGVCKIKIENSLAQIVLTETFDCKKSEHTLDISNLIQGVYTVKIDFENGKSKITKLVIQR